MYAIGKWSRNIDGQDVTIFYAGLRYEKYSMIVIWSVNDVRLYSTIEQAIDMLDDIRRREQPGHVYDIYEVTAKLAAEWIPD